ncbi:MAG TPA: tRNA (adenosine(37)-N6)-threonylcarbamoyltransferase complex dimerization subunit type 1 TsaB [Pyrinomonadaceae bacterium]|nr:tRNA (adenosine(37)-N6)-threonylcarbamoyltransferase complex dimerization subunit type 1 TsaB [Pyrinomonadaceae bacterium]
MSHPLILSIETATMSGSVAVTRGDEVLGVIGGDPAISHSNTLLADVDKLLAQTQLDLAAIDLFAVATGPGSFTGLRIGIATIKALADTLGRPCIGIPTLEAVALSSGRSERSVALLPAGRGEVFTQLFSVPDEDSVEALDEPAHVPPAQLSERYGHLENVKWCDWRTASPTTHLAPYIARLALTRFRNNQIENAYALRALYVRPADAQLKS